MGKYTGKLSNNKFFSILASHFTSKWDASGQIPERAVDQITRFGAIDDTEGGKTSRTNIGIDFNHLFSSHTFIKNKLFFFANYEKFEAPSSFSTGPSDYISGNPADVTTADANEVIRIARDVYGVDPGNWNDASVEEDEKLLLKIDWDINQDHRLSFTYQETEGEKTANNDGGNTLNLSSHWYTRGDALTAYSMQLFSDWNAAFSTQVRIANKEVLKKPQIDILPKGEETD